ncbi:MAG TPA: hypothetical protein VGF17_14735 [Phytomonospora sp.]
MDVEIVLLVVLVVVFPITAGVIAYVVAKKKEKERLGARAASRPPRPAAGPETAPSTVEELGPVVQRYTTDDNRRAVTALACLAGGIIVLAVAVPVAIAMVEAGATANPCGGVIVGAGAGAFGTGVVLGVLAWIRRGEVFDVHERGLVRHYAGRPRKLVGWAQIADVVATPNRGTWIQRIMGVEGHYRFPLRDGGRLTVSGYTRGSEFLAHAVERAAFHGETPGVPSVPCTICAGTGRYADGGACDVCGGSGRSTRSGRDVVG